MTRAFSLICGVYDGNREPTCNDVHKFIYLSYAREYRDKSKHSGLPTLAENKHMSKVSYIPVILDPPMEYQARCWARLRTVIPAVSLQDSPFQCQHSMMRTRLIKCHQTHHRRSLSLVFLSRIGQRDGTTVLGGTDGVTPINEQLTFGNAVAGSLRVDTRRWPV
jgi:hypothetical protein